MELIEAGVLFHAEGGGGRAVFTFPTLTALSDGSVLATLRAGRSKEGADERIELHRSRDGGRTWSELPALPGPPPIDGASGTLKICYLTEAAPGRLIAAAMWVDRSSHPGEPLFNAQTEGCLPMAILLSDSADGGTSWAPWRHVALPDELGPPSLTSPLLALADGTLVMSIETNKPYHDAGPWRQRAVMLHSHDGGRSWGEPLIAAYDPAGRIFNWDLRLAHTPEGRVASFAWTYDRERGVYINIHRRLSADGGRSWGAAEDLGFADQAGRPAVLPDGRIVLSWVDRFGSRSIRVRVAPDLAGPFEDELGLYALDGAGARGLDGDTGALLADMALWTFGLPYAEALPGGEVLVAYYAGTPEVMDIRFARLHMG